MVLVPRTKDYSSLPRRERKRLEVIQSAEYAKKLFEGLEGEEV